jgi:phosphoglucosamine mutase
LNGRVFGTDGVRGVANADLTPELGLALGRAGAAVVGRGAEPERPFVVGRDTRMSGTMLEAAVVAGITSAGRDVLLLGIVPTPGVARITALIDAAGGVMISASHNPIEDNGIKFFASDGFKLSDEAEAEIEAILTGGAELPRPTHQAIGAARSAHGLIDRYFATLLEAGGDLRGLVVVLDAAFGAAYSIGPRVFAKLGAEVVALHAENDGSRINVGCGSTDLAPLSQRVREREAEDPGARIIGVAFDGDADRVLFVDEAGNALSGDHILLLLAREKKRRGVLSEDTVVGTVMSNIGLERALQRDEIRLVRAAVGDRYVLETLRANGYVLGGEQSGHIIDLEQTTTGDGLLTAVGVATLVARGNASLGALVSDLHVAPQILVNVQTPRKDVLGDPAVLEAIARAERELGALGRILVRPSGTEPLIRVMIEGDDRAHIDRLAGEVAQSVRTAAQASRVTHGDASGHSIP